MRDAPHAGQWSARFGSRRPHDGHKTVTSRSRVAGAVEVGDDALDVDACRGEP
jgi:hypothetical protein